MKTTSIKWNRFILAIAIGSAVSAQILAMLHYWNGPHGLTLEVLPYTPLLALTYLLFMLPTAFIVGVPAAFFLNRQGLLKGLVVMAVGTLAGVAWAIPALGHKPPPYDMALFFGLGGFIAAALFWSVYAAGANK
jgi:hypothetical protein